MKYRDRVPSYDLEGKVALVTGSAKGIGLEIAGMLGACGAKVIITSRHQNQCDEAVSKLRDEGMEAFGQQCDVSSKEEVENLVKVAIEQYGKIDILINNAGVTYPEKPILEVTEKEWDIVHGINLKGLYFASQVVAKNMKEHGSGMIVNMTSAAGLITPKYVSVYGAAKAAVRHLTGIMAKEWARYGIRVNAVAPGYVKTDMIKEMLENEKNATAVLKSIPQRRYAEVEDVAKVVLFLVTNASDYLTGVIIPVDGGMTA